MQFFSYHTRKRFRTFVFLDLEATGLPLQHPKVTELCMIAVNRYSLDNPQSTSSFTNPEPLFPRVADKLCLYIDPDKPIAPSASTVTRLSNNLLQDNQKKPFNTNVACLLKAFLDRQAQPVCLVAHNGYKYDFPLLKAELFLIDSCILDDIFCVDSLVAIRAVDKTDQCSYDQTSNFKKKRKLYNLRDLFFQFYKRYPQNSHTAEGDATALIMVFLWKAEDLIKWVDENYKTFSDMSMMCIQNFGTRRQTWDYITPSQSQQRKHVHFSDEDQTDDEQPVYKSYQGKVFKDTRFSGTSSHFLRHYNNSGSFDDKCPPTMLATGLLILILCTLILFLLEVK
ncbi:three-prime repair exonuclease 1-like [Protopterus annectens]|uniref:three-prime repair exonuclease 1-like n=1 Tax=Protopterus annectens TaxID=7888 RepID=UPI001CFBE8D9|nr:three-prime repair exonuclease 1-like [Protopterus annectens]